jgi:hypothetical protein
MPTRVGPLLRHRHQSTYGNRRDGQDPQACLGLYPVTRVIIPRDLDYALQLAPLPNDPPKAGQLLAEAGYPNSFDARQLSSLPPF